jgi:hypothetical protein
MCWRGLSRHPCRAGRHSPHALLTIICSRLPLRARPTTGSRRASIYTRCGAPTEGPNPQSFPPQHSPTCPSRGLPPVGHLWTLLSPILRRVSIPRGAHGTALRLAPGRSETPGGALLRWQRKIALFFLSVRLPIPSQMPSGPHTPTGSA